MDAKIDHKLVKLQDVEGAHLRRARLVLKDSADSRGIARYLCDDPNHRWYGKPVYLDTRSGRWFADWKKVAGPKKVRAVSRWNINALDGRTVCEATARPSAWYARNGESNAMFAVCVSGPRRGEHLVFPERGRYGRNI